jgi:hypothetical protein
VLVLVDLEPTLRAGMARDSAGQRTGTDYYHDGVRRLQEVKYELSGGSGSADHEEAIGAHQARTSDPRILESLNPRIRESFRTRTRCRRGPD